MTRDLTRRRATTGDRCHRRQRLQPVRFRMREACESNAVGDPSAPITVGTVGPHEVAFLPRHGAAHEYAPHTVPYRAKHVALRSWCAKGFWGRARSEA